MGGATQGGSHPAAVAAAACVGSVVGRQGVLPSLGRVTVDAPGSASGLPRLRKELFDTAMRAGASGVGVCATEPFAPVHDDLIRRRGDGMAATLHFTYDDPDVATDVTRSFPWARRLVVVAWPYLPTAGSPGPALPGTGRIARFATADHYQPLRGILDELASLMRGAGFRAEWLSDDNRLVDRAAAVRAGVAWWGKNTMALAPAVGPWTLLGSVVTDAEIDVSTPMERDCGTCAACLPACPTGALVGPGVLDARLCLAHWAQAPGVLPAELRAPMGDRIYGCDDCIEACPPGARLLERSEAVSVGRVDLLALLARTDAELLEEFAHFYVPRHQARYLRRNLLVALGNAGGVEAEAVAIGYLGHPDWLLRGHAAWAVGRLGGRFARPALRRAMKRERRSEVRSEISAALNSL